MKSRWAVVLLIVALAMVAAGGWVFYARISDQYRTAAPLDVAAYISSGNSLRGNTYKLEGEVMTLLTWSPTGRLMSVGIDGEKRVLPVLLPSEFSSVNIQKGEKFRFLLVVDDKGVLRTKKLAKL